MSILPERQKSVDTALLASISYYVYCISLCQNFIRGSHNFGVWISTNHPFLDNLSEQRRLSLRSARHTDDSTSVVLTANVTRSLPSRLQKRACRKQR